LCISFYFLRYLPFFLCFPYYIVFYISWDVQWYIVGWKVQVGWHNSHNHQKNFIQDKITYKVVFIIWSYHTCQRGYL
jgi:hypothetical protein